MFGWLASLYVAAPVGDDDFLYLDEEEGGGGSVVVEEKSRPNSSEKIPDSKPKSSSVQVDSSDSKENLAEKPEEQLEDFDDDQASLSLGQQKAGWKLTGMDCPDCALKATRAVQRLASVSECNVSATHGSVEVEIDLQQGNLAQLNSVLSSLGHAPEIGWLELVGVKSTRLIERLSMDPRSLQKMLKNQPGLLDVELTNDDRVLIQVPEDSSAIMIGARDAALQNLTGKKVELRPARPSRLRPDQLRLLGGGFAIPLTILVIIGEIISAPQWMLASIAMPAIIFGGWRMFSEAFASLRNRQLGFQILTSLAVVGAAWLGAWSEALIVVVLVALASHMEGKALVRARSAMQGGLDRLPRRARLVESQALDIGTKVAGATISISTEGGIALPMANTSPLASSSNLDYPASTANDCEEAREIPLAAVQIGDHIEVRSGEIIPVDGTVIDGIGSIDRAPLTGESLAVRVEKGEEVEAGLILRRGPLVIEATAVGDNTRLSGLIDKVHSFRDVPPRFQSAVELFTVVWIPIVLIGAPLAWFLSGDVDNWKVMLLLWVVACPCALLLAAPLPHAAALANASHQGIIARGGDVIERAAQVNLALLDKTGTLTSGRPTIAEVILAKGRRRDSVIRLAAGLEVKSNHPYANVIREFCEAEGLKPSKVASINDGTAGISGTYNAKPVMFGRSDWLLEEGVAIPGELEAALIEVNLAGNGSSLLVSDGVAIALFEFVHDDIRIGAEHVVGELYELGVNIEILSGDTSAAVSNFGPRIGVPASACRGDMSPEDKTRWVEGRARTHVVLMAGDGFNDATAMAKADIGVAVGSGEQINLDAADIMITSEDPRLISQFIDLSRRTKQAVRQNIVLSVAITIVLVWSVLQGFNDKLWIGVLVHEASAILVILNGARMAGNQGMLSLLKGIFIDLWVDFDEALQAWLDQRRPSEKVSLA
jgi:Cd2+/Zn2+-exporting ATPase